MLTANATCSAYRALDETTSQTIRTRELSQRVGWLASLTGQIAQDILRSNWDDQMVTQFNRDTDDDGRPLPRKGYMAVRRLGLGKRLAGLYVPDRVYRMGQEHAGRLLRSAGYRQQLLNIILFTWPNNPSKRTQAEWDQLRTAAPGVVTADLRNRTRQIAQFLTARNTLPSGLCELEASPQVSPVVLAAAADRQAVTLIRIDNNTAQLRIMLPSCERPAVRADWSWVLIVLRLPPTVPAAARLRTPSLRALPGRLAVDLPFELPAPALSGHGHTRALGFDWGTCTFLTGTAAYLSADSTGRQVAITDGRPLRFDPAGAVAKWQRLRQQGNLLRDRIQHLEKLIKGRPDHPAASKLETLRQENLLLCARQRHLGQAIAWAAAHWAVEHAFAFRATVIYLEDLSTLEPGLDRKRNVFISGSVRGQLQAAMAHVAAKHGIAVICVPAQDTSSGCPSCLGSLAHWTCPQRTKRGYHWAGCAHCPLSLDRDHAASRRVVARGLASQGCTRWDRKAARFIVPQIADIPVVVVPLPRPQPAALPAASQNAAHPEPRKVRPTEVTAVLKPSRGVGRQDAQMRPARPAVFNDLRSVSLRRRVPSLSSAQIADGSQRPEGPVPTVSTYGANQDRNNTRLSDVYHPVRHRPRGARLGCGFHFNAYATPVLVTDGLAGTDVHRRI
jgi:hypothetical protein